MQDAEILRWSHTAGSGIQSRTETGNMAAPYRHKKLNCSTVSQRELLFRVGELGTLILEIRRLSKFCSLERPVINLSAANDGRVRNASM
jgi:hypothetical protein